jgi:cytochrome c
MQRNMIFGAVLFTAFVLAILGVVTPMFFEPTPPTKAGYAIAVQEDTSGAPAVEQPVDWGTALKTADVAAGQAKTQVCQSCHSFAPGVNNIGPALYGVVGRKPGTAPGFSYSPAMEAFGAKTPVWDYEHIFQFIAGPQKYVDGTKMTFIGMKDRQDRINVIAYLHTLGSNLPIPAPNPALAAAKPGAAPAGGASNTAAGAAPASNTAAGASNSAASPAPAAKGK